MRSVSIRLPDELARRIDVLAGYYGRSRNSIIAELLAQALPSCQPQP